MKHTTLVILIALAPLSWGVAEEQLVFYCERETEYSAAYSFTKRPDAGWSALSEEFDRAKSNLFLIKVDSQKIEMANRNFRIGNIEFVTTKFSTFENAVGTAITVEGTSASQQPFTLRLRGFEENGTFPYMMVRASISKHPFLSYEAGSCTKF